MVESTAPLAQLWRSVYRKAAEVAQSRAGDLLRDHVYLFHRTVGGGAGEAPETGPFVDEAGDTMTGALRLANAYLEVPGLDAARYHVYGGASAPFSPVAAHTSWEVGARFHVAAAGFQLVAVRWYRAEAGQNPPRWVQLFDDTAPSSPLWIDSTPTEFADPVVGWKTLVLPLGTGPVLVAGRAYTVAVDGALFYGTSQTAGYVPVGDDPVVFDAHVYNPAGPGGWPSAVGTTAYAVEAVVALEGAGPQAALSGAIRLQNGAPGVIAWRNGADTGDDTLTVNASDQLVYNGSPLGGGGGLATDPLADAKGDVFAASANNAVGRLAVGANGHVLTADSAQPLGVRWAAGAGGLTDPTTTTGDLIVRGGPDTYAYLVDPGYSFTGATAGDANAYEIGYEFASATARPVTAIGWYRPSAGTTKPTGLRLWDTTTLGAVINVTSAGTIVDSGAAGWQYTDVSALGVTLVAGRRYRVAYGHPGGPNGRLSGQTIPGAAGAGITRYGTYYFFAATANYPTTSDAAYYGNAIRLGTNAAGSTTRLPVGADGQLLTADSAQPLGVRWAAGVTGYLPLAGGTLTGDLVVSEATPSVGLKLTADTQPRARLTDTALGFGPGGATAPDATLSRTSAGALRADSHLGVGVNPGTWDAANVVAQVGAGASLAGTPATPTLRLASNNRVSGGLNVAPLAAGGSLLIMDGPTTTLHNAPAVAAGATQTMTPRLAVGATGTLALTPDAGVGALTANGTVDVNNVAGSPGLRVFTAGAQKLELGPTGNLTLTPDAGGYGLTANGYSRFAPTGSAFFDVATHVGSPALYTGAGTNLALAPAAGAVYPTADNTVALGASGAKWSVVYATIGTINTSSQELKAGITPLDPGRAMQAVRDTEAVTFDYRPPTRGPEWYDLPDDPEQAEAVLQQRLTAAPLEAAARHQSGFVAEQADELFLVGEGQTSPGNSVGVLLAALQNIDQRLSALEAP